MGLWPAQPTVINLQTRSKIVLRIQSLTQAKERYRTHDAEDDIMVDLVPAPRMLEVHLVALWRGHECRHAVYDWKLGHFGRGRGVGDLHHAVGLLMVFRRGPDRNRHAGWR